MTKLISVVIANYNYGCYLAEAIESVVSQGLESKVELIVCDGGSTDNSVDVIKKYEKHIAWWCSERDEGQSDAFNKGFSHAKGKYLTWLNADDILLPGSLLRVIASMEKHPGCEWFTANTIRFLNDGTVYEVWWGPHFYPALLQRNDSPIVSFGPSAFFSRALFSRIGMFDRSFHMVMDTDMWQRFILTGVKQRRINCFCWGFRMHESSKTAEFGSHVLVGEQSKRIKEESARMERKNGYTMSKGVRLICLTLRFFDGSLLRRLWYALTLRRMDTLMKAKSLQTDCSGCYGTVRI